MNNLPQKYSPWFRQNILLFSLLFFLIWFIPQIIVLRSTHSWLLQNEKDLKPAEVILVLGARVYPDHPSFMLAKRLDLAYSWYQKGLAPKILLSGGVTDPKSNEPEIMRNYLKDKGIPEKDLILDTKGSNTYRSLYRCLHCFHKKRILIATTSYHLPRSLYLAHNLGLQAQGIGAENLDFFSMIPNQIRESLARIKALLNLTLFPPALSCSNE